MSSQPHRPPANEPLLAEFPPVSPETWKAQVEAELKGAPFDKRMFSTTHEGITLKPIYRREDVAGLPHLSALPGFPPFVRGARSAGHAGAPWEVSQEIAVPDAAGFNDTARFGLSRGLTALNVVVDRATRNGADPDWAPEADIGRGGLSVATLDDLGTALREIDPTRVPLYVRSGASGMPLAALLAAMVRERGGDVAGLRGCIEMDPLGVLANEGRLAMSLPVAYAEMAAVTSWAVKSAPALQTICVHTRGWHEAGGHAVHELGFGLATALEYVRAMAAHGLDIGVVAPRLRFALTVGERFFVEIAKLRAARMLWARLVEALGGSPAAQRLSMHVRTSDFNKTVFDPHVNLLRTTVEAFAGVLGGCDSLQVGAFDEVVRRPDEASLRMARNQQLILREECQLTQVADPAGGSWYVESLTAELASRAWALMQEVERRGGMVKALQSGWPQEEVGRAGEARLAAVARRRESIIGTNVYANPGEKPLEDRTDPVVVAEFRERRARQVATARTLADPQHHQAVLERLAAVVGKRGAALFEACADAAASGATLGEISRAARIHDTPDAPVVPVRFVRAAEGFERLRSAVAEFARREGRRPLVFLATMGPPKQHRARADYARGLFEVAGLEVVVPAGFETPEAAVAAAAESGADAVCVCSTDETYPALVPPIASGLAAADPDAVLVLAGYPPDQIEAHKASGVELFIHVRADALEVLTLLAQRLGVPV